MLFKKHNSNKPEKETISIEDNEDEDYQPIINYICIAEECTFKAFYGHYDDKYRLKRYCSEHSKS